MATSGATKAQFKVLILDIETAPNLVFVWDIRRPFVAPNQIVTPSHVLCWAAKWHGKRKIMFSSIKDGGDPKKMIEEMWALLDEAEAVVHYNGRRFDIPRLNQEFSRYGLTPPSPYKQIDLYRAVRNNFSLPSSKMGYVCEYFGLGEKVKHAGMELWMGVMKDDPKSWKTMEKYNKGDVRLTERLYNYLIPWIKGHPNVALYKLNGGCINCGSTKMQKRGLDYTRCLVYQRYKCLSCGKWQRSKTHMTPDGVGVMRE